jgi:hypothetical protein
MSGKMGKKVTSIEGAFDVAGCLQEQQVGHDSIVPGTPRNMSHSQHATVIVSPILNIQMGSKDESPSSNCHYKCGFVGQKCSSYLGVKGAAEE